MKNDMKTLENTVTGKGDDNTTGCFKKSSKR